jgi:O-antigen/teichoic acid export membrane protein
MEWLNRNKYFKQMSISRVAQSFILAFSSIIFSLMILKISTIGLILANITAYIFSIYLLYKSKVFSNLGRVRVFKIIFVAKKFKRYPQFDMGVSLLNNISQQSPVLFLTFFMGPEYSGPYYLVERLLALPLGIVSNSVGSVFREQATKNMYQSGNYSEIFIYTFKRLVFFASPLFIFIFLFGPNLFSLFLGDKWSQAGSYAQILVPMYFMRFITSPLSYSFYISNKLHLDLYLQALYLLAISGTFFYGYTTDDVYLALKLYSLIGVLLYSLFLVISYNLSKCKN